VTAQRICHVTTAHRAGDVRIFERECRAIAENSEYEVMLIAPGEMPGIGSAITLRHRRTHPPADLHLARSVEPAAPSTGAR
jgi:hypothetical protein